MKTVLDLIRQPLVIGALVLSILIIGGAYFGSHWYYGDVKPVQMPEVSAVTPPLPKNPSSAEVDLSGLQGESLPAQAESTPTVSSVEGESVDDFLAELSDEEKALLAAEVVEEPQPVSPFGFGPYPKVPADFPEAPIWDEDPDYPEGDAEFGSDFMRSLELIDRVLIELWNQGHRATSGEIGDDDMVLPFYPNTVYVKWAYTEEPDGTITRYASEIASGPDVPISVHDAISEEGAVPFGIKELDPDNNRIDPFTFLNLNQ